MTKNYVLITIFAAFLMLAFSSQTGSIMPEVDVAYADVAYADDDSGDDSASEDDDSSDVSSYACVCPPGITACVCSDGSAGEPSDEKPSAAGAPGKFRSL